MPADWELLILDLRGAASGTPRSRSAPRRRSSRASRENVRPWLDIPVALFGHNLGAILAAEVGRACEQLEHRRFG